MKPLLLILMLITYGKGYTQELFVYTEPASNMPANSIGLRLSTRLAKMNHSAKWNSWRVNPEMMVGVNKNLMLHITGFSSNMFQRKHRFEGAGIYAKYRVYSADDIHRHFRLATYARLNLVENPSTLKIHKMHFF